MAKHPFIITIEITDTQLMKILAVEQFYDNTRAMIKVKKKDIIISAHDHIALKATLNGLVKLIETYYKTKDVVSNVK